MTLDTRARRAAQGIRRAVEVMEMSTSTREPRKVERFDRFRDRKQRNRQIGAILVVATIVIATIVVVTNAFERRDTKVPVTPPSPTNRATGRIVFTSNIDPAGRWDLFTMRPDGTGMKRLTVLRVVALSGGYSREEANARLSRNQGVVASFSRALTEGLSAQQSDEEFDAALDGAVASIFAASKT